MKYLLALSLLALCGASSAQVSWEKQLDWNNQYEYFIGVALVENAQNIVALGGSGNFSGDLLTTVLFKLAPDSAVQWSQEYTPEPNLFGNAYHFVQSRGDTAILLENYVKASPGGIFNEQIFLSNVNLATGQTNWFKEYGDTLFNERAFTIRKSNDGGFVFSGLVFPTDNSAHSKMLLMKTDSAGNLLFRKQYSTGSFAGHTALSLALTNDGGYLLYGYRNHEGTYPGGGTLTQNILDMILLKTDAQGNQQWIKIFQPWEWKQNIFFGYDIQPMPDGNYLVSAAKAYALFEPGNAYSGSYFFAKINPNGAVIDSTTLPGRYQNARINRLIPDSSGNFWAVGAEKDTPDDGQTAVLMKITPQLDVKWKREYRVSPPESTLHEMLYNGVELPDHGFVLCGTAFGALASGTNQNGWLLRVDSLGCLEPGCQPASDTDNPAPPALVHVKIYPNPSSGLVQIAVSENNRLLGIRVLDQNGKVVSDKQYLRSAAWTSDQIDLRSQAPGIYLFQCRTTEGWAVEKVFKQ